MCSTAALAVFPAFLAFLSVSVGIPLYIDPDTAISTEHLQRITAEEQVKEPELPWDPRPPPEVTREEAEQYLIDFGFQNETDYLATRGDQVVDSTVVALKRFQHRYQLPETGKLDDDTKRLIATPRCGFEAAELTQEEFVFKWRKPTVTYQIQSYPTTLSSSDARRLIRQSFEEWNKHLPLNLVEVRQGDADIYVSNEPAVHRDRRGFECKFSNKNTLAHAFFPQIGDVHYNSEKRYTEEEFLSVSMHEIGHSLGLNHTTSRSSIMFPIHIVHHLEIPPEDRHALQELYGGRAVTVSRTTTTARPTEPPTPQLCSLSKINTIVNDKFGRTFALADEYYYDLSIRNPRGRRISEKWPRLPGRIDAAFTYRNGRTFFFKGSRVWIYDGSQLEAGYPRQIADELPGLPNYVDAVYLTKAGSIVAMKKRQYWFYNPAKRPQVSVHFPRPLMDFRNMPVNVDAALYHTDGRFYFFKDHTYYQLNLKNFTVDSGSPVTEKWFKC